MEKLTLLHTGPLGVNTYIIPLAENSVLVIDPAACALTRDENAVTGFLSEHSLIPAGIVITHGHFDHITGLKTMKKAYPDCRIAIHKNDAAALGTTAPEAQHTALSNLGMEKLYSALTNMPQADVLLNGGETLDSVFTGNSAAVTKALSLWKVIHTPGHSAGGICLYNAERKELISGDTLFYRSYGRTDIGGDEGQIIHSLVMLKETLPPETRVYPGHEMYGFRLDDGI